MDRYPSLKDAVLDLDPVLIRTLAAFSIERTDEGMAGDNPLGRDIRTALEKALEAGKYGGTLPACRAVHCRCMARGYRTGPCADVGPARTGAISPNGMVPCPTAYRRADRWADRWAEAGLWVQVSEIQSERPRAGYRSSTARSAAPTRRPRLEIASGSRPRSFSWRIAPVAPAASRRRVRSVAGKGGVVSPCFPP